MEELLAMFKLSIGNLSGTELDTFYTVFIQQAQAILRAEDISGTALDGDLGKFATVLCAQLIMENKSLADNATLILLRSMLTAQTKGERV